MQLHCLVRDISQGNWLGAAAGWTVKRSQVRGASQRPLKIYFWWQDALHQAVLVVSGGHGHEGNLVLNLEEATEGQGRTTLVATTQLILLGGLSHHVLPT